MKETVYLLNDEGTAYHFTFLERSCHCDGHSAKLVVSPMDGVIPPHSKLVPKKSLGRRLMPPYARYRLKAGRTTHCLL